MKARLTVVRQPSEIRATTVETRYAFEGELEAMFALGVVNALAQHLERGVAEPVYSDSEAMTSESVAGLREAVKRRYVGIGAPSAMDGVDEFLTHAESTQFRSAVSWLTAYRPREAAVDVTDTSVAAIAGGLLLRSVMGDLDMDGRVAASQLLGRAKTEMEYDALSRLGGIPETVDHFAPAQDPQYANATMAHITLSASPVVVSR